MEHYSIKLLYSSVIEKMYLMNIIMFVQGAVKCLDFSPDRDLIVTGGEDRNVKVWKRS